MNYFSVFDNFVGLALKRLRTFSKDVLHKSLILFFFYKSLLVQDANLMFFSNIKR